MPLMELCVKDQLSIFRIAQYPPLDGPAWWKIDAHFVVKWSVQIWRKEERQELTSRQNDKF